MSNTPDLILGTGSRYPDGNEREFIRFPARELPHSLVSGVTGAGKSRWAAAFAVAAMAAGIQVIVPDITGSTSQTILKTLLMTGYFDIPGAFERLTYLDIPSAAERGLYAPYNVLQTGFNPHDTSDMVLEGIRRISSIQDSHINIALLFKLGAYVLACNKLPLFPFLYYLFVNPDLRARLLVNIDDDVIKIAFAQFGFTRDGNVPAAMQPTIKRLQLLVMNPILRYSLGQQENVLDIASLLKNGKSLIVNLKCGVDAAHILATLLMAYVEMAAPFRGDVSDISPPQPCLLLLDEFQTLVSHSESALSAVLERFRKHNVKACLLHQHFGQIPERLLGALTQCGIVVAFHLDRRSDAKTSAELLKMPYEEFLAKPVFVNARRPHTFTPQFYSRNEQQEQHMDAIATLRPREAFIRVPHREQGSVVYKMRTLTVDERQANPQRLKEIEELYLQKLFRPKEVIDAEIAASIRHVLSQKIDASSPTTEKQPDTINPHDSLTIDDMTGDINYDEF